MERPEINFHERQEQVWIAQQTGGPNFGLIGVSLSEVGAGQIPGIDREKPFTVTKAILYRPSLAPVYGGPTLLEALWSEMDALVERLMTGTDAEDGGDRFRAEELAWVIAICSNAYEPSMDAVRAEAMERWRNDETGA